MSGATCAMRSARGAWAGVGGRADAAMRRRISMGAPMRGDRLRFGGNVPDGGKVSQVTLTRCECAAGPVGLSFRSCSSCTLPYRDACAPTMFPTASPPTRAATSATCSNWSRPPANAPESDRQQIVVRRFDDARLGGALRRSGRADRRRDRDRPPAGRDSRPTSPRRTCTAISDALADNLAAACRAAGRAAGRHPRALRRRGLAGGADEGAAFRPLRLHRPLAGTRQAAGQWRSRGRGRSGRGRARPPHRAGGGRDSVRPTASYARPSTRRSCNIAITTPIGPPWRA